MALPLLETWHLAEPTTSSRGQRSCQLTAENSPLKFLLGSGLSTRYGATTFDRTDAPRRNLEFVLTDHPAVQEQLRAIDDWAVAYLSKNSARLFGKELSIEEATAAYRPLLRAQWATVRTKINVYGARACTYWDSNCLQLLDPPEWHENSYDVLVSLPQLWIMGADFGFVVETLALKVRPLGVTCPSAFKQSAEPSPA